MDTDPWLDRWIPSIRRSANLPDILELGCGEGRDTRTLLAAGFDRLTALDRSEPARHLSEEVRWLRHDLREPLPFADATYDVVLASLCLHYFAWEQTEAAVREVRRVLRPGGLLLCRVNSVHDVHHGATGFPALGPHFYQVNGRPKRFFDEVDLRRLFVGWPTVSMQELTIARYEQPKAVWEVILTRPEEA